MKKLIIATRNPGKVKEIKSILGDKDFHILSLGDIGYEGEIIEDKDTFVGNAVKKASTISSVLEELTLADDSGLEVDALDGMPGVLSARFAGVDADDKENNEKLLKMMKDIPEGHRGAQFSCAMVLAVPGREFIVSEGVCRGKIVLESIGHGGFGYDPLFIPHGYEKTMAELSGHIKNKISHRAMAIRELKIQLQKNPWVGE